MQIVPVPGPQGIQGIQGPPGKDASEDAQIVCEECIKYWLLFLNNGNQVRLVVGELSKAINEINFGEEDCTNDPIPPDRDPETECLNITAPHSQLFEICKQLELALELRVSTGESIDPETALEEIELDTLDGIPNNQDNQNVRSTVMSLFDCFEEALLPLLFPDFQPGDGDSVGSISSTTPQVQQQTTLPAGGVTVQSTNPQLQQSQVLPAGDPLLQLKPSLLPIS